MWRMLHVIFLERYYIDTALLVIIHISKIQKWAAGYNPPLHFGRRTERRYVYKMERVYIFYIQNVVGEDVYFTNVIYGGRTSLFLTSQRMPAAKSSDCEMIQL